ncbi:7836_t:CDS:2, partial [Funneliformis geosporum]
LIPKQENDEFYREAFMATINGETSFSEHHEDSINEEIEWYSSRDKVLYFEAAKDKTHSGKLDQKWKGPYYIHQLLLNGSYKIRELDGRVLRTPVNGDLLK